MFPLPRATTVPVEGPVHLEAIVRVLQRRPVNRVDVWEDGCWRRLLDLPEGLVPVEAWNAGSVDRPRLRVRVHHPERRIRAAARRALRPVLGLDADWSGLGRLAALDPRFAGLAAALRGLRPPRFPTLFETFGNVVPFQQVSLDAGAAIQARFVERFGPALDHAGRRWHAFPRPEAVAEATVEALRGVGLSRAKAESLKRLGALVASGAVGTADVDGHPSPEALDRLTGLPGIGRWSAGLVLLRGFARLDVFPTGDAGVVRGLREVLSLPFEDPPALERFADGLGEVRGWLYYGSLAGKLLERGLISPA